MQQFASSYYRPWILPGFFVLLCLGLTSCGGGGKSSSGGSGSSNTLVISLPTGTAGISTVSVNFGEVQALKASLHDSSGNSITTPTITWTTDAPTIAGVTANGALCGDATTTASCICGGDWQNSNVDCVPPTAAGTATVTAKASSGETASVKVFVHPRISRVSITTPVVTDCTSSTGTLQLAAQALDINNSPVTVGNDATAFTWTSSDSTVASVDNKGLVTSANPGKNNIFASVGGQQSPPYPFTTCGVKSIHIHVKDVTDTSLTVNTSVTTPLVADVVDTKGQSITLTGSRLIWAANRPGILAVDQSGGATSVAAGTTGIVASCSPPLCNSGMTSVFSNVLTATVNGTTTTQVLATSSAGTSLVPIDSSANTAGTAITLPSNPNSIVYAGDGSKAFLGSSATLMSFDPAASTVTSLSGVPGMVVAVSNNAQYVILYDATAGTVTVFDASANSVQQRFSVSGIPSPCRTATSNKCPRASFTPDNRTAFIVAGPSLYVFSPSASLKTIPLGTSGNDVAVTAQGSFAFVANSDSTLVPYATCNNAKVGGNVVTLAAAAQDLIPSFDGTALYAVAPPNLNVITATTDGVSATSDVSGCVPSLTTPAPTTVDLGQGAFSIAQPIISTSGNRLYFLTGGNSIVAYDKASNAGFAITLASSANALSGGLTSDGANLYLGGSDGNVHRIDTSAKTDAGQISVGFTPDLVAVRPK